jgi:hypothetical protein
MVPKLANNGSARNEVRRSKQLFRPLMNTHERSWFLRSGGCWARTPCRAITAFVSNTDDALVSPLSLPLSAFIGVHQRLKLRSSRRSLFR